MSFLELARKRYSVRRYKSIPVEEEKLMEILEAGRIAPSAANFQPWKFVVIKNEEKKRAIASTYHDDWILQAPIILVICGDHSKAWRRERFDGKDHCDIDIAIAVDHMTLAAADLGLGTCWICHFDAKKCKELLKLPKELEAIVLLPLGYPADMRDMNRHDAKRKTIEEIVCWDGYHA